ncbi:MAG: hypothetical protein ACK5P7_04780 [Bdellovibrio sp.]|jgi:hypothetical protein
MKSVTEFPNFTLSQALKTKTAMTAEGKTPEEIQTSLGETFKLEGDKLKHFISAIDIAGQNPENLKRVVVVSLNEGETAPSKATKVEELHFVPEFYVDAKARPQADAKGGRGGRGGGGRGGPGGKSNGPKSSPWGLSPEEKAAKKAPKAKPTTN